VNPPTSIEGRLAPPLKVRPGIGRIVHYHPLPSEAAKIPQPFAALVSGVFEGSDGSDLLSLHVFAPGRAFVPEMSVREGGPDQPGTWSWPPRV
jgi:hypothetical protein